MKVALIPCGATEWHDEGRLLGRVELPLTRAGEERCSEWAEQLFSLGLRRILHGPDELSAHTAAILARRLSIPTKAVDELIEVDIGLWTGLTEAQLHGRYPSAHRELGESPLNVHPPGGESLADAAHRLAVCLHKRIRKIGTASLGVVLRPLALILARATLDGHELTDVWQATQNATEPVIIDYGETDPARLSA